MFDKKVIILLVTTGFLFCDGAFVDTLGKCQVEDTACEKDLIQKVLHDIAKTGAPELGIPPIDPLKLSKVSVSVLDVVDISLEDGYVRGVQDCVVQKFTIKVKAGKAVLELLCDVSVKGKYNVHATSPMIKDIFGGEFIKGDGNGKVKIDKAFIRIEFKFYVQKRDGEIYFKCIPEEKKFSYDIRGNMAFLADNLYIGNRDVSKPVTTFLNQNWKMIISGFGKPFMDKCTEIIDDILHKFFDNTPTKYYILDDLSLYAREE